MKSVSIFNHKGGVGKTTLSFNLTHALANLGHTVLLIDADAQCNLTAISLDDQQIYDLYNNGGYSIQTALNRIVTGAGDIDVKDPFQLRDNIFLLPGHISITNYESQLNTAWNECFTGLERGFRTHSAIHRLATEIGNNIDADYIIYDLGPNVGPLNRSLLLASDFFMTPVVPDQFSILAIDSVGSSIQQWYTDWGIAKQRIPQGVSLNLQEGKPKFCGYVSQQFNISRGNPTQAFQRWEQQIPQAITDNIINTIDGALTVQIADYAFPAIKNYHSLVPAAQTYRKPIFELHPPEINAGHSGKVRDCRADFENLANEVVNRTS